MPHFDALMIYSCGKHCEKSRNCSQCFLSHMAHIIHFKDILICCLQSVFIWTSLKFCRLVMGQATKMHMNKFRPFINGYQPCSGKWDYVYSIAIYQKYLTRLGELIISSLGEKIIISPNRVRYF